MNAVRLFAASIACATLVACGGASTPSSAVASHASAEPEAASVWRSKCGSCHAPVEPGSHRREEIETALQRHRKRVRLSDDQWARLVDFLAPPQQAKIR